jgi:hypothetical protein
MSFREWATRVVGERGAELLAGLAGAITYHHDPGELSAPFVFERARHFMSFPPTPRYVVGGWGALIERLADRARALGARIVTGKRAESLPEPPVILALPLEMAARLLGDPGLTWPGSEVAALGVGLRARRGDTYVLFDLDEAGLAVAYSTPDRTLAPPGHRLIQAQIGKRLDESFEDAFRRLARLLDAGFKQWRDRLVWRRRLKMVDQTGALDPAGTTWRDRPAIERSPGVYVVGDKVAAPGLLGEVSFNAALIAVAALADVEPASSAVRPLMVVPIG